jgi:hypothetical protein
MLSDALLTLLREFGPLLGLILFFVWRDWKREDKLAQRIEALEAYQRDTLVDLLRETTVALTNNGECLKWIGRIVERVCGKCPRWEFVSDQPEVIEE